MSDYWFCMCGKLNVARDNKCPSCGGMRWVTERKENPEIKKLSQKPK